MSPPRRFDHDEAKRLRAEGWTLQAIADAMGVSLYAVWRAVSPRGHEAHRQWQNARYHARYGIDDAFTEKKRAKGRAYYHRKKAAS